jgi:Holliday junction resolvasome RuvABC endonuclease subunit
MSLLSYIYINKNMTNIAIDLSKTSPGIAVYNGTLPYQLYFFNHRKSLLDFHYKDKNIEINEVDFTNYSNIENRVDVYTIIIDVIKKLICNTGGTKINIENYAFGATGRGVTGLAELRGALLYALKDYKNVNIEETAIGTWKKWFTGKGNASKMLVYENFKHEFGIDLLKIFKLKLAKNGDLPAPIPDLCDATGILYTALQKVKNPFDVIGSLFET